MEASPAKKKGKGNTMKKKVKKNNVLPLDVLEIIYRKLDFGDIFNFAGVCKNWRIIHKHHWKFFMESQSPLIVEMTTHAKKVYSFHSIHDLKIYRSTMPCHFTRSSYCGCSSGYLIFGGDMRKTLMLMNPFTRRKKQISLTSGIGDEFHPWSCRALLAFAKGSQEEFVVVVSSCTRAFSHGLSVYQSRNSSWVTYSTMTDPWKVVDFAVLRNTIYALTAKAEIGVLSLNSARVKFIDLKNTPLVTSKNLKLVVCDGELLVVHFKPKEILNVYKVDLSTMEYVKLESLGDIALFCSKRSDCYALSNPGRCGFDSNSVYHIDGYDYGDSICEVYSWNNELKKRIVRDDFGALTPKVKNSLSHWLGWCFRHLHNEIDYAVVD